MCLCVCPFDYCLVPYNRENTIHDIRHGLNKGLIVTQVVSLESNIRVVHISKNLCGGVCHWYKLLALNQGFFVKVGGERECVVAGVNSSQSCLFFLYMVGAVWYIAVGMDIHPCSLFPPTYSQSLIYMHRLS